jgi:hypothetical protein
MVGELYPKLEPLPWRVPKQATDSLSKRDERDDLDRLSLQPV